MRRLVFAAAALAAAACSSPGAAPSNPASRFEVRHGDKILAREEFTRTGGRLRGALTVPGQVRVAYDAQVTDNGATERVDAQIFDAMALPGAKPAQRSQARFQGDSVFATTTAGDSTRHSAALTSEGAVFYLNPSVAWAEEIVRRAKAMSGDKAQVPVFLASNNGKTDTATVRLRGDSAIIALAGAEMRLALDSTGSVTGGAVPSQGVRLIRLSADSAVADSAGR